MNILMVILLSVLSCSSMVKGDIVKQHIKEAVSRNVLVENEKGHGSGVVIATNLVLTCQHMIGTHMFVNGVPATILRINTGSDLMLLSVETGEVPQVRYATKVEQGDVIFVVGNPLNHRDMVSIGRILDIEGSVFYSDAHVFFGNSGGGAYNTKGELIGILFAMEGNSDGHPFAMIVSIDRLLEFFK